MITGYYNLLVANYEAIGKEMQKNRDATADVYHDKILRKLDCLVIEFMHSTIEKQIKEDISMKGFSTYKKFDSSRGVFTVGGLAFVGAGFQLKSHIQICIRNPNSFKGFFLPGKEI